MNDLNSTHVLPAPDRRSRMATLLAWVGLALLFFVSFLPLDEVQRAILGVAGFFAAMTGVAHVQHRIAIRDKFIQTLYERFDQLMRTSITDTVTGLFGRAYLPEILVREEAAARRYRREFSVVYLRMEQLATLPERFGPPAVNLVLQRVAQSIRETVRKCDVAIRLDVDEFLVVLPYTNGAGANRFLERISSAVHHLVIPLPVGDLVEYVQVGVEGGFATFPSNAHDVESLLERAGCRGRGVLCGDRVLRQ